MPLTLKSAIAAFGTSIKKKLSNPAASGQPEDQLRAPFEGLLVDLAELSNIPRSDVTAVGESAIRDLRIRPDYSVTVRNTLIGFIELKAPGKGADPRKFKDRHDKGQWERLRSLPNLMYSDGNSFSLWRDGELAGPIISFVGDIETVGSKLDVPSGLLELFQQFFLWEPISPRNAKELAEISARLCRLLRDEVIEQMTSGSEALTALADDWRKLLFPDATNERFADGYAQAVTFGLLMARANGIELATGLDRVAKDLSQTNSLIGTALRLLTENPDNQSTLRTSLGSLTRVLDAVDWPTISKGDPETWLYFYEDFLEVYDNKLRKLTGSYYTPPEVVETMVRLVDEVLKSPGFGLHAGLASPSVTVADPATGTGTYILAVLKRIAQSVSDDEGEGAVSQAINSALKRLVAFEIQLGPFAVAQLRILAEVIDLTDAAPTEELRMFVTDTLCDPNDDQGWIPGILAPIAKSRKEANKIKREESVTVVIGNPPYKEKAKGRGGWVEAGSDQTDFPAPLADWMPPKQWGVGAHARHLRNLYIYFWRWATWKVFDHHPESNTGIVCFITMAGFLGGEGFQRMREYLRETCDQIWIIDCSPEGHQPEVKTRIFQGVQQPVCIVLTSRSSKKQTNKPATVRFRALPAGLRTEKFTALHELTLDGSGWVDCPEEGRAPFFPASIGAWATYPFLEEIFNYNGSGVMPGRTWVIAPDAETLSLRWQKLINAPNEEKELLFHPHMRKGELGDKHSGKIVRTPLARQEGRSSSVADDKKAIVLPIRYAYRSFDRQWIIPDNRLINQPNPTLWAGHSSQQIYLTAPSQIAPTSGPGITFTTLVPDLHHYNGRGGRAFPLWMDAGATVSNIKTSLLRFLAESYGINISPENMMSYVAALTAHPGFAERFREDLSTPGLRIPLTADSQLFTEIVSLGQRILWLHTFGDRMTAPTQGRPSGPPRLHKDQRPSIPKGGAIPIDPDGMPDAISYDDRTKRLLIGDGYVENVSSAIWNYEVSGKQVILHWFSYRKKNRDRPIIGDRRPPSPLCNIQPDHWLAEYTTELINLLNVLGLLVELEPRQAELLERVCHGETFSREHLESVGAFSKEVYTASSSTDSGQIPLF